MSYYNCPKHGPSGETWDCSQCAMERIELNDKMRPVYDAAMALYEEMGEVDPELFSGALLALRDACRRAKEEA